MTITERAIAYQVNDVYPTVQGEGAQTGVPMVVVRLQGCPVGCHFCDTKETWAAGDLATEIVGAVTHKRLAQLRHGDPNWTWATGIAIAEYARALAPNVRWIMLTGGEPAEQQLDQLIAALHARKFRVAIETSGTAIGHLVKMEGPGSQSHYRSLADWTCVSPKVGNPGARPLHVEAIHTADEIKWIVGKAGDLIALEHFRHDMGIADYSTIALQPMSTNANATKICLDAAIELGCRVSIQVHKYIQVP